MTSNNKIVGWKFFEKPNYSPGLNDTIFDWKESKAATFVREICQNSNDAIYEKGKPVIIEFSRKIIKKTDIPDYVNYRLAVDECHEVSKQKKNNFYEKSVFERMQSDLDTDTISVLVVSDYNTRGLEAAGKDEQGTPWYYMTGPAGSSDKPDGFGGSKGVGKKTFYEVSSLRTIFIQTKAIDGGQALWGNCRFIERRVRGTEYSSIGYWSYDDRGRQPLMDPAQYPEPLCKVRSEFGTDIYILGYDDDTGNEDWTNVIKVAIVKSFFLAILAGRLIAVVDNQRIEPSNLMSTINGLLSDPHNASDKELATLPDLIAAYTAGVYAPDENCDFYYAKTEKDGYFVTTKTHSLMTIVWKPSHMKCSGIAIAKNKFEQTMGKLENAMHTEWKIANLKEEEYRKDAVYFVGWFWQTLSKHAKKFVGENTAKTAEAAGVGKYLGLQKSGDTDKLIPSQGNNITISALPRRVRKKKQVDDGGSTEQKAKRGEVHGPPYPHPSPHPDPPGPIPPRPFIPDDGGDTYVPFNQSTVITEFRCINRDNGQYNLYFNVDSDSTIRLELNLKTEEAEGKPQRLKVTDANDLDGNSIPCEDYVIGPFNVKKGRNRIMIYSDYPGSVSFKPRVIQ